MSDWMQPLSDEELLARYRASETAAEARGILDELFRRLLIPVSLCCYRWTGDHEWAADLAQEVLMQAFRNLDSFRGDSKISTWVYTIARNHCRKAIRGRPGTSVWADHLVLESSPVEEDPYEHLAREASAEAFRTLLRETLTESEIRVITLHYAEEVPLAAITELMGLRNASGAKAYIVSARRKLHAALQQYRDKV